MTSNSISLSNRIAGLWNALDSAWRWALGVYFVARVLYSLWALVVLALTPVVVQNLDLFGTPLLVVFDMATGARRVYSREVGGAGALVFRSIGAGQAADQFGGAWSLMDGKGLSGPYAGQALPESRQYTVEDVFPYHDVAPEQNPLFSMWQRFDVIWYQAIAERGYAGTPGAIHFPPLYPALEGMLGRLLGGSYFFAGWLISQFALIGCLGMLYRLTARWQNQKTARRAVVFMVLFPTAFFFFTAYSEALFLLLTLLCFDALRDEKWLWAGFWAFLAILTRLQGVALFAPLVYCAWHSWRAHSARKQFPFAPLGMLALPLLSSAFYLFLRALVGDSFVVPLNEPQLNARLAPPWDNIVYAFQILASGKFLIADVLNLCVFVLVLFILWRGWRILPVEYALYTSATLLVASARFVDTQPLNSMTRYVLTLFPLFMLLALWSENRWVERAVVYVSLPLNLYLTAQFLLWGWVA